MSRLDEIVWMVVILGGWICQPERRWPPTDRPNRSSRTSTPSRCPRSTRRRRGDQAYVHELHDQAAARRRPEAGRTDPRAVQGRSRPRADSDALMAGAMEEQSPCGPAGRRADQGDRRRHCPPAKTKNSSSKRASPRLSSSCIPVSSRGTPRPVGRRGVPQARPQGPPRRQPARHGRERRPRTTR